MSSLLSQYLEKERQLESLQAELEGLESSEALKADLAFRTALTELLEQHEKTSQDAIEILDPNYSSTQSKPQAQNSGPQQRKKRKLKIFENPHTGERIETRGGNQKTLKAWKNEHGEEAVNGWLIEEK